MKCPVCNENCDLSSEELKEGFYYDCEHCQSSLFFKGGKWEILSEAVANKETHEPLDSQEDAHVEEDIEVPELTNPHLELMEEDSNNPPDSKSDELLEADSSMESIAEHETEDEHDLLTEVQAESLESEEESISAISTQQQKETKSSHSGKEDFSDITNYGNKQGLGDASPFYYDLILSEINSEDIRNQIENLLKNIGFNLSMEDQALFIENGLLKLAKMSPIKVHIIVKALMGLPVQISWEQHLVTDQA